MYNKIQALAQCLGLPAKSISKNAYGEYCIGNMEYLVLCGSEVKAKASEEIENSLWAFRAKFILDTCGFYSSSEIIEAFATMLGKVCESGNPFVKELIDSTCGMQTFVDEAISADGAAHFIARYDGKESISEINGVKYYIYRVN